MLITGRVDSLSRFLSEPARLFELHCRLLGEAPPTFSSRDYCTINLGTPIGQSPSFLSQSWIELPLCRSPTISSAVVSVRLASCRFRIGALSWRGLA